MAAPQVLGTALSDDTNLSGNAFTADLPAGIQVGERIIIGLSINNTTSPPTTFPVGWTKEFETIQETFVTHVVASRIADGTEGSSITVTLNTTNSTCAIAVRVEASGSVEANNQGNANGTQNPVPSISPSGGADDYLFLVFDAIDTYTSTITTFPTNYVNTIDHQSGASGARCRLGYAERESTNVTTESPTNFVLTAARRTVTSIVAIAPAGGPPSVVIPVIMNQLRTQGVA